MHDVLRIPRECGALLAVPSLHEITELLITKGPIGGSSVRQETRVETLRLAALHTAAMDGGTAPTFDAGHSLLVTGHQPEFYHPGIWIKNFMVDAICRQQRVTGLNLIADSDVPSSRAVELPALIDGHWHRRAVTLEGVRLGLPWETQPALDAKGWELLLSEIGRVLPDQLRGQGDEFAACVGKTPSLFSAVSLADSLARARRAWESRCGPRAYLELPLSVLCNTSHFYRFVSQVLSRLEEFWGVHNACLAEYRAQHRIRSTANPVPDLRHRDQLWETPFWCMHANGARGGLFVEREGTSWSVQSKDTTFGRLHAGEEGRWPEQLHEMMRKESAGIRPRAMTLTMFARLYLADMFLHGVGGARYERVSDAIMQRYFQIPVAPYAVASGTFCVQQLPPDGVDETPREIRRKLRDLHYNPQRFARESDDEFIARKLNLIAAINKSGGAEKKLLAHEIEVVNGLLIASLRDTREELEQRESAADDAEAIRAVTQWRGYPYFLFDPRVLSEAVDRQIHAS